MEGKKRGGSRPNSGPKSVPYIKRAYRVPKDMSEECSREIKEVLKKYRDLCMMCK
jgi:hypothetical protein